MKITSSLLACKHQSEWTPKINKIQRKKDDGLKTSEVKILIAKQAASTFICVSWVAGVHSSDLKNLNKQTKFNG